jgi:hypothetical protein
MDSSAHISNTAWEDYSRKLLDGEALRRLEEHTALCGICADVKEGIDSMKDPSLLASEVQGLNTYADAYTRPVKKKQAFAWYWSAAAVIIFGVGFSLFVIDRKEVVTANEEHKQATANEPAKAEEKNNAKISAGPDEPSRPQEEHGKKSITYNPGSMSPEAENGESVAVDNEKQPAPVSAKDAEEKKAMDDSYVSANGVAKSKSLALMDTVSPVVVNSDKKLNTQEDVNADFAVKEKAEYYNVQERKTSTSVQAETVSKTRKKKSAPSKSVPTNIMTNTDREDNVQSNTNRPSINLNAVDSADYLRARWNYDSAHYDKCIVNLYYITINPDSKYYEDGLLLKAKALIKQGKKEDAKVALNSIIMLNKERRKEAFDLLNSIK